MSTFAPIFPTTAVLIDNSLPQLLHPVPSVVDGGGAQVEGDIIALPAIDWCQVVSLGVRPTLATVATAAHYLWQNVFILLLQNMPYCIFWFCEHEHGKVEYEEAGAHYCCRRSHGEGPNKFVSLGSCVYKWPRERERERERERGRLYKRAITDPPSIQKESLSRRQNPDRKGPLTKWVELRIIHCDKRDINRKAS